MSRFYGALHFARPSRWRCGQILAGGVGSALSTLFAHKTQNSCSARRRLFERRRSRFFSPIAWSPNIWHEDTDVEKQARFVVHVCGLVAGVISWAGLFWRLCILMFQLLWCFISFCLFNFLFRPHKV